MGKETILVEKIDSISSQDSLSNVEFEYQDFINERASKNVYPSEVENLQQISTELYS